MAPKWYRKVRQTISLRTQFILGTGLILSLASLSGMIGYLSLRNLQNSIESSLEVPYKIRELSLAIQNAFLLARQDENDLITHWRIAGFDVSASVYVTANQINLDQSREYLGAIEDFTQGPESDYLEYLQTEIDALWPLLSDYESTFKATEEILRNSNKTVGQEDKSNLEINLAQNMAKSKELSEAINEAIGMIAVKSKAELERARLRLDSINRNATITIGLSSGLAILMGMIAAAVLARGILLPIRHLSQAAQKMGQGDLQTRVRLEGVREFITLANTLNAMAEQLQQTLASLEQRVTERTYALQRRSRQLQAAAQIAREATATHELQDLLVKAVDLIQDRFSPHQTDLYTVDETGEWAILRATSGRNQAWQSQNSTANISRLRLNEVNLFTQGVESYTEINLPLKAGARIVGILKVQNQQSAALDFEDITILQIVADQLAVAIQNAYLFEELQDRLRELETLYSHQSQEAWLRLAQTGIRGYQYDSSGTKPIEDTPLVDNPASDSPPISLPIRVRGQVIGSLDVWPEQKSWPEEKTDMLQAISARIGQAIDSARLFEEVQALAARERMLNQLTARFTQSLDFDALLQTAVQELSHLPNVSEISIQIGLPQ